MNDYINAKLNYVKENYSIEHQAIGLAFETEAAIHAERHVISQIIIIKYKDSDNPTDILAVAIAYTREGAKYRKIAINYFERFFKNSQELPVMPFGAVHPGFGETDDYQRRVIYSDWYLHSTLSELYEKEYEYEKAIAELKLCIECSHGENSADYTRIGDNLIKISTDKAKAYYDGLLQSEVYKKHKTAIDYAYRDLKEKIEHGYVYKPRKTKTDPELSEEERFYIEAAKQFI